MKSTAQHVGVTVSSLDEAVEFYSQVLGCRVMDWFAPGAHEGVRVLVGLPDADVAGAFLALPDGRIVELLHYRTPRQPSARVSPAAPGTLHLAVPVTDIEWVVGELRARGGTVVGGPVVLDGNRMVYARDPDGTLLELVQPARGEEANRA